jgi:hypothetical protein
MGLCGLVGGQDPASANDWKGWRLQITDESGRVVESLDLDGPLSVHSSRH